MQTNTNAPNISQIQTKLVEYLTDSGWRDKLKTFISSDDFTKILDTLAGLRSQNKRFTPPIKNMLNCFALCPYRNLKIVFLGPGPFDGFSTDGDNMADGLLFSHPVIQDGFIKNDNRLLREAAGDKTSNPDLSRWAKQGILLLNTALTKEIGTDTAHYSLYKDLVSFVLDMLNSTNQGLVFVFIGPEAAQYAELVSETRHHVFKLDKITQQMNANYIFSQIDKIMTDFYKTKINW